MGARLFAAVCSNMELPAALKHSLPPVISQTLAPAAQNEL